jgi:hypothetical protein
MTLVRHSTHPSVLVWLIAVLGLTGACGGSENSTDNLADDASNTVTSNNGPNVSDDAPDPLPVDEDELEILDEWQEAGVPQFPNSEVLDFEPHASRIENGGTLLLDAQGASPEEVLGFYRGALGSLDWDERRVGVREMTAESDVASLLVTVNQYEEQTLVMMILTDRVGQQ